MLCDILYGAESKKMTDLIRKMPTYGKLKHVKKDIIKEIIRFLIMNNYLFGGISGLCEVCVSHPIDYYKIKNP